MSNPVSLQDLVHRAHQNSVNKGFWDGQWDNKNDKVLPSAVVKVIPEKLCLIHSEVSEALEDYRAKNMTTEPCADQYGKHYGETLHRSGPGDLACPECGHLFKPVGFPSELADIFIRLADLCGALGINLEQEVLVKMAYNETRSYKHGKVC